MRHGLASVLSAGFSGALPFCMQMMGDGAAKHG